VHFADTAVGMAAMDISLARVALVLTILIDVGSGLLLITGLYVRYTASQRGG
jgi:hypothetical protein